MAGRTDDETDSYFFRDDRFLIGLTIMGESRHGYFLTQTTLDPLTSAKYDIDTALRSPLDYTGLPSRS